MVKLYSKTQDCYGCTACENICPKSAISMLSDTKGFLYPQINSKLCVGCGLCKKVCPIQKGVQNNNFPQPDVYAVKHKSDDVRMLSSSGGMFTAISDYVLEQGGTVYGAAFDDNFVVFHKKAVNSIERDAFRGSKYVQSDLKLIFKDIMHDLMENMYVMFSGTPCQCAGLYNFLSDRVNIEKLYLCDIVCHGTPSPKIFLDYISYMKKKFKSPIDQPIDQITFRYKPLGWRSEAVSIQFKKLKYMANCGDDVFLQLFSQNVILRDSCYICRFANLNRPADITIGDFWGVEKSLPYFEDEKGVSLVLVNTHKGRQLFDAVKNALVYHSSNASDCMQPNLSHPSVISPKSSQFWTDYKKHGFVFVANKYTTVGVKGRFKKFIKYLLKKIRLYGFVHRLLIEDGRF